MNALLLAKFLPTIGGFVSSVIGTYRVHYLDVPGKIMLVFAWAGFAVEAIASYAAIRYGNNMPVYSIYSLMELGLITSYFNFSVKALRIRHVGLVIGVVGIILGILNIRFLQPLIVLNSYFLYLEGVVIIGLSFFSFYRLVSLSEDLHLAKLRHFWFPFILCSFWTVTFLNWGLYEYFNAHVQRWTWLINLSINVLSCLTYLAIALVFWRYPKLSPTDE